MSHTDVTDLQYNELRQTIEKVIFDYFDKHDLFYMNTRRLHALHLANEIEQRIKEL